MRWSEGHPLKDAGCCPWCMAQAGPEPGEGFGCEHEIPLQAIEETLNSRGYPDPEAAVAWLVERKIKFDAMAFFCVSNGVHKWRCEEVFRKHFRAAAFAILSLVLISVLLIAWGAYS